MPVTFDAQATGQVQGTGVTTVSNSGLTIGTGNCLVAWLSTQAAGLPTFSAATWGSQNIGLSATVSNTVPGGGAVGMWVFLNPTAGNQTLTFSWSSGAQDVDIFAASFNNVASFLTNTANNAGSNPATYSAATGTDHIVVDGFVVRSATTSGGSGTGQTTLAFGNAPVGFDASYISNQSTATFVYSLSASVAWASVLADLAPFTGAAAGSPFEPSPVITQSFRVINY